ncbi:hypothetical protein LguiA_013770 [Lonicera macranthoides]
MNIVYIPTQNIQIGKTFLQKRDLTAKVTGWWRLGSGGQWKGWEQWRVGRGGSW